MAALSDVIYSYPCTWTLTSSDNTISSGTIYYDSIYPYSYGSRDEKSLGFLCSKIFCIPKQYKIGK